MTSPLTLVRWCPVAVAIACAGCGRIGFDVVGGDTGDGGNGRGDGAAAPFAQGGYLKAPSPTINAGFGDSIALSDDGATLAVGADFTNNMGAVYVFTRSGASWTLEATITPSNPDIGDQFGFAVALSADGSTLAVGAPNEASSAVGVGGNQADDSLTSAGAAYVFTRAGTTWTQQAYVKASNTAASDSFGIGIAVSGDGSTLAVGADGEDSAATGVGGNQADNTATSSGAIYVFTRAGVTWAQQAYVKASNTEASDGVGRPVALSFDGSTLAFAATGEDSAATGINGNQADNSAAGAGSVYVLTRAGTVWTQQAYVKQSNTEAGDFFGVHVRLSGDGSTLAVGAQLEDSAATGIDGNQLDNSASGAGAAYVFGRSGTSWSQQAYIKASNPEALDQLGFSLALSSDGTALATGAINEASAATGINGDQANNSAQYAGAVYLFTRTGTAWGQRAYVKASNTEASDGFGYSVALSADGATLVVSAPHEDSGVAGDQADNSVRDSGAIYVFQ